MSIFRLKFWNEVNYPTTIVCDRYGGTYSHARYLAFPLDIDELPEGFDGGDTECVKFWEEYTGPVGKVCDPNTAMLNLAEQVYGILLREGELTPLKPDEWKTK